MPESSHAHLADADHDHPHGHSHAHSPLGRLRHLLSHLFGTHSHDVADQIDDELEASAAGRRALWISLAGLGVTAILQGVVFWYSGSVALLGDTLHNLTDALTAIPLLAAFALGRRVPTRRFTYGFGRAEDLAGLFVVAMIALSAVVAGWEAVRRLVQPQPVTHLAAVAVAALIGFVGNELVARYRIGVGRRIGSAALIADGLHARTDGFTSLAVLFGAGGVALGWNWADPVVGLLITIAIIGVLRGAVRQVGGRLLDAVDPALIDRLAQLAADVPGVRSVADVRARWLGHQLYAELTIRLAPAMSLADADRIGAEVRSATGSALPRLGELAIRVAPQPTK